MTHQLYALFDIKNNFFYVVHHNKLFIDSLAELDHLPGSMCVIALHDCINWHHNLIDNSNCYCWGLNAFFENSRLDALKFNDLLLLENPKELDENQQILKSNLESILKILSNLPQRSEYKLPQPTLSMFAQDSWIQHAQQLENQHYQNYKNAVDQAQQYMQNLIKQQEIDQVDSINKLKNKLNQYCTQSDKSFLIRLIYV